MIWIFVAEPEGSPVLVQHKTWHRPTSLRAQRTLTCQSSVFHRCISVFCWWKTARRGRKRNSTHFRNIPSSVSVSGECICRPSKCTFNKDLTFVKRHNLIRGMQRNIIGLSEKKGYVSKVRGPYA